MFGKVNKEQIETKNDSLEKEMHSTKPDATQKKTNGPSNAIGNVLGLTGSAAIIIAGVGAASLALNALVTFFGLSSLVTVLILIAIGLVFQFGSTKLITDPWVQTA